MLLLKQKKKQNKANIISTILLHPLAPPITLVIVSRVALRSENDEGNESAEDRSKCLVWQGY